MGSDGKTIHINLKGGDDEAPEKDNAKRFDGAPMFANVEDAKNIHHVTVYRNGPVPEGGLGRFPIDTTEDLIAHRFGGGNYTVQAKDAQGQVMKGGTRTIEIAGTPILVSHEARLRYSQYLKSLSDEVPPAAAQQGLLGGSMQEFVTFVQTMTGAQEEREAQRHERQLQLLREEAKLREQQIRQDAAQARAEANERQQRDREFQAAQADRDRQFMLLMQKSNGGANPLETFMAGLKFADKIGGGGGDGDWIDKLLEGIAPAIAGKIGLGGGAEAETPAAAAEPKQIPPRASAAATDDDNTLVLKGTLLGAKAKSVVDKIKRAGGDPGAVFAQVLDRLDQGFPVEQPPAPRPAQPTPNGAQPHPAEENESGAPHGPIDAV